MRKKLTKGIRPSLAVFVMLTLVLTFALVACSGGGSGSGSGDADNGENDGTGGDNVDATGSSVPEGGEDLIIQVGGVSETVTFYPLTVEGTDMEVLAVRASDGTIRTAFNTCKVCHGSPKAYFVQGGDMLQCQKCGKTFPIDSVSMEVDETDNCNPIPILDGDKTVTDETITISYEVLKNNIHLFPANWKE